MPTNEITSQLNKLLADYMVYYQKLRNYHWNVRGHEFFKLHEKFEEAYLETAEVADSIAERILALGDRPYSTLNAFLENAQIKEDPEPPPYEQMVRNLCDDIQTLNRAAIEITEAAEDKRDRTTANLLDDIVDAQEERLWMFRQFLND